MGTNTRRIIFHDSQRGLLLKGLVSSSISEPPVPLFLDGQLVGKFQVVEIFLSTTAGHCPQLVADLICNTYVRLTYTKENGTSATFGTSIVSAPSYRLPDGLLQFIPKVLRAEVKTTQADEVEIALFATYGEDVGLVVTRTYPTAIKTHLYQMRCETHFTARKNLQLAPSSSAMDTFRLFSISSMYANQERYDANIIRTGGPGERHGEVVLSQDRKRGVYIFARSDPVSRFEVLKGGLSGGAKNSPGSPDSPSICAVITDCSFPSGEIGVQGYLDLSTNVNDDSLTVWPEWLRVPPIIERGTELRWATELTAFLPQHEDVHSN